MTTIDIIILIVAAMGLLLVVAFCILAAIEGATRKYYGATDMTARIAVILTLTAGIAGILIHLFEKPY